MKHPFADIATFKRDPLACLLDLSSTTEDALVRLRLGPHRHFLVNDPDTARAILKMPETKIGKGALVRKLEPIIGRSSLTVSGPAHKARREILHEVFARSSVEAIVPELLAEIRKRVFQLMQQPSFNARNFGAELALKLVTTLLFGHDVLSTADELALIHAVRLIESDVADEMFRVLPRGPLAAWRVSRDRKFARAVMSSVVRIVQEKAADVSIVAALRKLGLSEREMNDEIITMLLAGHHTTGAAIAWMLYYIAINPDLAENIAKEAEAVYGADGDIDPSRLRLAPLSLALVKETLRLYPSSWWFAREAKQSQTIGRTRVKRGDALIISPWVMHRSTKYWSDPDKFDINRDFGAKAYMPFGSGPRACIGMGFALLEMQLVAIDMVAAFRLETRGTAAQPSPSPAVTLLPPSLELSLALRNDRQRRQNAA